MEAFQWKESGNDPESRASEVRCGLPPDGDIRFRVGAPRRAISPHGIRVFMQWVPRLSVLARRAGGLSIGTRKVNEEIVEGVMRLEEEHGFLDAFAVVGRSIHQAFKVGQPSLRDIRRDS